MKSSVLPLIFPQGKKGMEMWQLILIILAVIFLLFMIAWYGGLNESIKELLGKLGEMF